VIKFISFLLFKKLKKNTTHVIKFGFVYTSLKASPAPFYLSEHGILVRDTMDTLSRFLNQWIMPLFFAIAGFAQFNAIAAQYRKQQVESTQDQQQQQPHIIVDSEPRDDEYKKREDDDNINHANNTMITITSNEHHATTPQQHQQSAFFAVADYIIRERVLRLLLPFFVSIVIVVFPLAYLIQSQFFLPFIFKYDVEGFGYPNLLHFTVNFFTTGVKVYHMWFLVCLFAISLLELPFMFMLYDKCARAVNEQIQSMSSGEEDGNELQVHNTTKDEVEQLNCSEDVEQQQAMFEKQDKKLPLQQQMIPVPEETSRKLLLVYIAELAFAALCCLTFIGVDFMSVCAMIACRLGLYWLLLRKETSIITISSSRKNALNFTTRIQYALVLIVATNMLIIYRMNCFKENVFEKIQSSIITMYWYKEFLITGFLVAMMHTSSSSQHQQSRSNSKTSTTGSGNYGRTSIAGASLFFTLGLIIIPFLGAFFTPVRAAPKSCLEYCEPVDSYVIVLSIMHTYTEPTTRFMYHLGTYVWIIAFGFFAYIVTSNSNVNSIENNTNNNSSNSSSGIAKLRASLEYYIGQKFYNFVNRHSMIIYIWHYGFTFACAAVARYLHFFKFFPEWQDTYFIALTSNSTISFVASLTASWVMTIVAVHFLSKITLHQLFFGQAKLVK